MNQPAEVLNALVAQADSLAEDTNHTKDADNLAEILNRLDFLSPLWIALGYGYKVNEVRIRIHQRASYIIELTEGQIKVCQALIERTNYLTSK